MVLMIMSLFAVAALPRLGPQMTSARLTAGRVQVSSMVNLVRFRAIETGRPQELIFDLSEERILAKEIGRTRPYMARSLSGDVGLLWVSQRGSSTKTGTVKAVFLPNGTTVHTRIKLGTQTKELLVEINGADSRLYLP